jgi:phenylalanine-4-hydroxylase
MPLKKGLKAKTTTMIKTNFPDRSFSIPGVPEHLLEYITEQDPSLYTPEDHAAWRFIMAASKKFFKNHAHPLYWKGIESTGISTDRIPLISEMDEALKKMGWRAVAINGFIPPSIFLELQSLRILAIACDMRKIDNLGYTPSPDIVHEAAGHAPIVCDPKYREYLEAYGKIARNAIISKQDLDLYDAIFNLSEIKENPKSSEKEIEVAQRKFEEVASQITEPSEAALLARMAWWTTEYGLVEVDGKNLIYGAGLLSSVTESHHCIHPHVKKIPFQLNTAIQTSYDITKPQPQLFVAKDFESLTMALEEFANKMSFRRGGEYGMTTAKKAEATVTVEYDHGLQVTGIVTDFKVNQNHQVISYTLSGSKQFSQNETALEQFDDALLGSEIYFPLFPADISKLSTQELILNIGKKGILTLSGEMLTGEFKKDLKVGATGRVIILENVKITSADGKVVYSETSKPYPLILGSKISSVFGGAADRKEFSLRSSNRTKKVKSHKTNATDANRSVNELYRQIRQYRENNEHQPERLEFFLKEVLSQFKNEWLASFEVLELISNETPLHPGKEILFENLKRIALEMPKSKDQIQIALELIT